MEKEVIYLGSITAKEARLHSTSLIVPNELTKDKRPIFPLDEEIKDYQLQLNVADNIYRVATPLDLVSNIYYMFFFVIDVPSTVSQTPRKLIQFAFRQFIRRRFE